MSGVEQARQTELIVPDLRCRYMRDTESASRIMRQVSRHTENESVHLRQNREISFSMEAEAASAMWEFISETVRLYMPAMHVPELKFPMPITGHQSVSYRI